MGHQNATPLRRTLKRLTEDAIKRRKVQHWRTSLPMSFHKDTVTSLEDGIAAKTIALQNEIFENTRLPDSGGYVSLITSSKRRHKELSVKSRKRLKSDVLGNRMLSETEDILNLITLGQESKAAELYLKKRMDTEVISNLLENDKCSRSDVQSLLNNIVEILMSEMQGRVKSVWVGFRQKYPNIPVFVLIYNDNGIRLSKKDIPSAFRSFEFIFRHEFEVSKEAREITKSKEIQTSPITKRTARRLKNTLSKNIDQLLKYHSNIEMVGVSTVRSTKYGHMQSKLITDYCIVLYVHVKGIIPFTEKEFPSRIDNIPVDVREGKFVPYSNVPGAMEYHNRLLMGCQIVRCSGLMGTLGGFVDLQNGGVGILTCAHVALTEEERNTYLNSNLNEQVRQRKSFPWRTRRMGQPDQHHEFGTVRNFALTPGGPCEVGVDAAVVTITEPERKPVTGAFPKDQNSASGFSADNPMEFNTGRCSKIEETMEGCEVLKFGAASGITRGLISSKCLYAKRSLVKDLAFKDGMYNQMEISPLNEFDGFAQKGDSGAIVFIAKSGNRNTLAAVGMVVGGTTSNTTVVTPIVDIFKALGLKNIAFKAFDPSPRPRQLLSMEDLQMEQEKQSKQIKDQEKHFQEEISMMKNEIKKDIANTQKMIERLSRLIKAK